MILDIEEELIYVHESVSDDDVDGSYIRADLIKYGVKFTWEQLKEGKEYGSYLLTIPVQEVRLDEFKMNDLVSNTLDVHFYLEFLYRNTDKGEFCIAIKNGS